MIQTHNRRTTHEKVSDNVTQVIGEKSFRVSKINLVTSSLAINILSLALPIMTLQVYDRIIANQNEGTLRVLVFGVVIAIILELLLKISRAYVTSWAGVAFEHATTCNALWHYMNADLSSIEKQGTGEQLQNVSSIGKLREFYGGQALITLVDLPFVMIFLGFIWYLAGSLVIVSLSLLCIFMVVATILGSRLKKAIEKRDERDDRRYNFIIETLQGIHTVKSLGLEDAFQRRYEHLEEKLGICNYRASLLSLNAYNCGSIFAQIMMIAIITVGAPMVINGAFTTGTLVACILLSGRIMQPVQRALSLWTRFQDFRLAKEKVESIFSLPRVRHIEDIKEPIREGTLRLKDVYFSYGPHVPPILRDINLELFHGDIIAISGHHGAGRTTLLKLMAGIYMPLEGSVTVDDVEVTRYNAEELVDHIGFMSVDTVIFQGTIRDNLTTFKPEQEDNAIEIAKLLNIHHEIIELPTGYDTMLNDGPADPIPPGLKQRIAIARVLVSRPRLLLFDNADRALDKEGYNTIVKLLTRIKGKATMVIVSDDHNIMRLADREYILKEGILREKTDYDDDTHLYHVKKYQELKL